MWPAFTKAQVQKQNFEPQFTHDETPIEDFSEPQFLVGTQNLKLYSCVILDGKSNKSEKVRRKSKSQRYEKTSSPETKCQNYYDG